MPFTAEDAENAEFGNAESGNLFTIFFFHLGDLGALSDKTPLRVQPMQRSWEGNCLAHVFHAVPCRLPPRTPRPPSLETLSLEIHSLFFSSILAISADSAVKRR